MSLLGDILDKLLHTADDPTERALRRGGSVMSEAAKQERASTGNPLLDTVNQMISVANPVNWMGGMSGASEAIIAPTSNKLLQTLWQQAKNVAPKLVQRAEGDPRTLFSYLVSQMPHGPNLGTYQDLPFGPQLQKLMPKGSPVPGSAEIWGGQSKRDMLSTLLHEMTHFLTGPNLEGKNPEHALETAKQLGSMMPSREKAAMARYVPIPSKEYMEASSGPIKEVLQRLKGIKDDPMAWDWIHQGFGDVASEGKLGYNEALSYLTESLLKPSVEGADPALGLVADALGHGLR